jgi:tetratricopeptide (TPR) repeat protein
LAAACLLNPSHVHAFAWPPELSASAFSFTAGGARSPFQAAYFAHFGPTPAVLAYFPLLALGLLSFLSLRQRLPWGRLLPWLGLGLLSAFQAKAIPLFAVVAGPVLARNIQDGFGQRTEAFRSGRGLALLGAVVLAICAWPGWLQAPPFEPRRWSVEPDPSLEAGATAVRQWHQDRKVGPEARGLHLSAESLHAFAWFCPQDRGVFDEELAGAIRGDREMAPDRWAERMRALGVDHIIVYDADPDRRFVTSGRLLSDPESLPLLALEGHLAVFGWRDPDGAEQFRGREFGADRRAFHRGDVQRAPKSPGGADGRRWWEAFWKPVPRSLDHEAAPMLLMYAEALRHSAPPRHMAAWNLSRSAACVGAAAGWSGPGGLYDAAMRLTRLQPQLPGPGNPVEALPVPDRLALQEQREFTVGRDDAPPALLYLAVRAARRAVAADPDDAKAYLALGESYLRLMLSTRERAWARDLPELAQLRRAQASAALNRAVVLKPDLAQAHLSLVGLYREMGYLDLTLQHLRTYLQLARIDGPPPGADPEKYQAQEQVFEDEIKALARQVEDAENTLAAAAPGTALKERAQAALRKGLAGRARDMLLASDISEFGPEGMTLELQLQLGTGHAREVWDWTGPEQEHQLGPEAVPAYHWIRARALAASGEYELARQECEELARAVLVRGPGEAPTRPRELLALMATQTVLAGQPGGRVWGLPAPFDVLRTDFGRHKTALARMLRQEADAHVLRGLLALEEGDVEEAAVAFRTALQLWRNEEDPSVLGMDFAGRAAAQACLEWMGE